MRIYRKNRLKITQLVISTFILGVISMCMISCDTEGIESDALESSESLEQAARQNNLSGEYRIASAFNGHYLTTNSSNIVTNPNSAVTWEFIKDGTRSNGQQLYKLHNVSNTTGTDYVLDVERRSTENGANVHQYQNASSNDDNQRWYVHLQVESGTYILSSENGGRALDRNTTGGATIRNVHMWRYGGNSNQRWILTRP